MATALREAREELGVSVATEKVWGILKPLRDRVSANAVMSLRVKLIKLIDLSHHDGIIAVHEFMVGIVKPWLCATDFSIGEICFNFFFNML